MLQTKEGEEKLLPVGGADDEGNQIPNFFDPSTKKFYQLREIGKMRQKPHLLSHQL